MSKVTKIALGKINDIEIILKLGPPTYIVGIEVAKIWLHSCYSRNARGKFPSMMDITNLE